MSNPDTYSSGVAIFLIFGKDREIVENTGQEIVNRCKTKGVEYGGPHSPPSVNTATLNQIYKESGLLFQTSPSEEEESLIQLEEVDIYRRIISIENSDSLVADIAKKELPDGVFIRLKTSAKQHYSGGKGTPFTYDPTIEYNSEL